MLHSEVPFDCDEGLKEMQSEIDSIKSEYQQESQTQKSEESAVAGSLYEAESPNSKEHGFHQGSEEGFRAPHNNLDQKELDTYSQDADDQEVRIQYLKHQSPTENDHTTSYMNGHTFQHIVAIDNTGPSYKELRYREQEDNDFYLPEIPEGGANTEQGSPAAGSSNLTNTVWVDACSDPQPETKSYFIVVKKMFNKRIINEAQKGLLRDLILAENDSLKMILRQYEHTGNEQQFYSQIRSYLDSVAAEGQS